MLIPEFIRFSLANYVSAIVPSPAMCGGAHQVAKYHTLGLSVYPPGT
jgi:hypothetical protein